MPRGPGCRWIPPAFNLGLKNSWWKKSLSKRMKTLWATKPRTGDLARPRSSSRTFREKLWSLPSQKTTFFWSRSKEMIRRGLLFSPSHQLERIVPLHPIIWSLSRSQLTLSKSKWHKSSILFCPQLQTKRLSGEKFKQLVPLAAMC